MRRLLLKFEPHSASRCSRHVSSSGSSLSREVIPRNRITDGQMKGMADGGGIQEV
jgi:hypothetical protein